MDEERRKELEEIKTAELQRCRSLLGQIRYLSEKVYKLEDHHRKSKRLYEDADRQLAMYDARFKKLSVKHNYEKEKLYPSDRKPQIKLTVEQINSIAKQLGIKLKED